ncbi:transporter (CPA2 family) [Rhodothalassium salexigens DSM 2132]|uniref:Transporter (CPA2 family) n=1 Tax=Rhodothalassium salexigens DSM 2132 TaxID=1188247 RepID=A0A4R2P830_RHOSA|nr:cation:proton antiporter family protein [Rhodothalassium salexigens]MBB4212726.1 Kef-type K+ transport system membrane component KefB [Rhodothalassium salexigens DSM 2132]MBK1639229.1 sodium:proton exchanger [Rhodothalassium salexigens DSM 2132]TCP30171.1 transporter (CPA2 family) [Rhodothalassium salexigens DSM 2132]
MLDLLSASIFYQVAALLVLAGLMGLLGVWLRQPLIVSFIAVGILAGPSALGLVHEADHIELLAELGIAVLLFLVGLKLDLNLIRSLGPVAAVAGLAQVALTGGIGFAIAYGLGFDVSDSLFLAVALTFSSTIIIVKLLSDKRAIDSLYGRLALGVLIIQDLVVVLAMIVLSAHAAGQGAALDAGHGGGHGGGGLMQVALNGVGLLVVIGLFMRYAAEPLMRQIARSPELLLCFSVAWAALLAAGADFLGLSKEMGGLLAGVSLASTQYREAVAARLAPLRDFLLLFFFIGLGTQLELGQLGANLGAAAVLSVFVLIGKPVLVTLITAAMGYRLRTGVLSAIILGQISEFSLIFMAMGAGLGLVSDALLGLITLVGLITIALSTYAITYLQWVYLRIEPLLRRFERDKALAEVQAIEAEEQFDMVVIGLGRFGGTVAQRLAAKGHRILGVDFNPAAVRRWRREGLRAVYGDATDADFVAHLPLENIHWIVSAVPDHETTVIKHDFNSSLIDSLKSAGFKGKIAVTCHGGDADWQRIKQKGADLVLMPFQDAADRTVELLEERGLPWRLDVIEPDDQREFAV